MSKIKSFSIELSEVETEEPVLTWRLKRGKFNYGNAIVINGLDDKDVFQIFVQLIANNAVESIRLIEED